MTRRRELEKECAEAVFMAEGLVADLRDRDLTIGPSLGAALSVIYTHLLMEYDPQSKTTVLALLSTAMASACLNVEMIEGDQKEMH